VSASGVFAFYSIGKKKEASAEYFKLEPELVG